MEQDQNTPRVITYWAEPGDPTLAVQVASTAWAECQELQLRTYSEFAQSLVEQVEDIPRLEIISKVQDRVVGAAVLTYEYDPHVGLCASVVWNYVLPGYRGTGIARRVVQAAQNLAREAGLTVYAYSHRSGPFEYKIKYRRVHE